LFYKLRKHAGTVLLNKKCYIIKKRKRKKKRKKKKKEKKRKAYA
jgi:hypothetical protein